MKSKIMGISQIAIYIIVVFMIYKIHMLEEANKNLLLQVKELHESNGLRKSNSNSNEDSHLALAWQNNKGKWGILINDNFFPLKEKPVYAFKHEGNQYDIYSGLSLKPGDSSRVISTSAGRLLIHSNDPRFFHGISLNPDLKPVLVRQEILNEK
jgi:hypothetical protein